MPSSALWKLRRLAGRAIRVVDRRKGQSRALAVCEASLPAKARAYMEAYDGASRYGGTYRRELAEGKNAAAGLLAKIMAWVPLAARDIKGMIAGDFGDQRNVPDDIVDDADRLYDLFDEHRDDLGAPLAYREAALADLGPAIDAATKEWGEAETADKRYQDMLRTVRQTAVAFDDDLKPFRRSLAAVTDRKDKDYQKLRASRAAAADDDDDPAAPPPPNIEPAPPGGPPPL